MASGNGIDYEFTMAESREVMAKSDKENGHSRQEEQRCTSVSETRGW